MKEEMKCTEKRGRAGRDSRLDVEKSDRKSKREREGEKERKGWTNELWGGEMQANRQEQ